MKTYYRKTTDPIESEHFDSIDEVMAQDEADALVIVPVTKVQEIKSGYAVRFLIGDGEGNVDGDEINFFDTVEEAEKFISSMKEGAE
jgi:hypothetical protein